MKKKKKSKTETTDKNGVTITVTEKPLKRKHEESEEIIEDAEAESVVEEATNGTEKETKKMKLETVDETKPEVEKAEILEELPSNKPKEDQLTIAEAALPPSKEFKSLANDISEYSMKAIEEMKFENMTE